MFTECRCCGDKTWCSWYGDFAVCGRASCLLGVMRRCLDRCHDRM